MKNYVVYLYSGNELLDYVILRAPNKSTAIVKAIVQLNVLSEHVTKIEISVHD